jgi:hypothetical protein
MYGFSSKRVSTDSGLDHRLSADRTRAADDPQAASRPTPHSEASVRPARWVQVNGGLAINLDHVAWVDWPEDGTAECVLYLTTPGPGGARTFAIHTIDLAEHIHELLFPSM